MNLFVRKGLFTSTTIPNLVEATRCGKLKNADGESVAGSPPVLVSFGNYKIIHIISQGYYANTVNNNEVFTVKDEADNTIGTITIQPFVRYGSLYSTQSPRISEIVIISTEPIKVEFTTVNAPHQLHLRGADEQHLERLEDAYIT